MRTIEEIFHDRTCYKFLPKPIERTLLLEIYDLVKLGPTSANCCPLRITFIESDAQKEKLYSCLDEFNIEKSRTAPVTAVFAFDPKFYELMPKLFPHNPAMKDIFANSEALATSTATRNSTLQSACFMIVARSKGLSCGPMSGFNNEKINETFFKESNYQVNYICNLGYPDGETPYARLPRLDFDEVCKII